MSTITIRRTLATLALLAVALPAGAAECTTGAIDWVEESPRLTYIEHGDGITYAIIGQYVNYQTDGSELASALVPDGAVGVTVCPDGVTFELAAEPVEQEPPPVIADVSAEQWNEYVETADPEDVARYWAPTPAGVRPI